MGVDAVGKWQKFPHDDSEFAYAGPALGKAWAGLHAGDRVAWPDRKWLSGVLEANPDAAPDGFDGDLEKLTGDLQDAWRAFHGGRFGDAIESVGKCGLLAHAVANKAAGVYATYLETNNSRQQTCFLDAAKRAEQAQQVLPDDPNSHYFHAFSPIAVCASAWFGAKVSAWFRLAWIFPPMPWRRASTTDTLWL